MGLNDTAYRRAQLAYDSMEHPDYWDDPEHDPDYGEKLACEAEWRRDLKREGAMIKSAEGGDHESSTS